MSDSNDYSCTVCGATGVKLWRRYQTLAAVTPLLCVVCAHKDQNKNLAEFNVDECDSIGWTVPAVPDGEGSFWGYTSVPQDRVDWWAALPFDPRPRKEVMTTEEKKPKKSSSRLRLITVEPANATASDFWAVADADSSVVVVVEEVRHGVTERTTVWSTLEKARTYAVKTPPGTVCMLTPYVIDDPDWGNEEVH